MKKFEKEIKIKSVRKEMKKMKKYIVDLCCCDENEIVREMNLEDKKEFEMFLCEVFVCSLDKLDFERKDINKKFWILEDGGEVLLLKDGRIMNVCFRGDMCRVWESKDEEYNNWIKEIIKSVK